MKRILFLSTIFLLLSTNFGFTIKSPDDVVPPDFGKEPTTILVLETPRNNVNKAIESAFEKSYTGTIQLISMEDFKNKNYSDMKKYHYCFMTNIKLIEATGMGNSRIPATYEYSYVLLDRETSKTYGFDYGSNSWKNLLKKYVKKLEEAKQANEKK